MKATNPTAVSVDAFGRLKATTANGATVITHTNPAESRAYAGYINALSLGREELGLLLTLHKEAATTAPDGRTKQQLERDWLAMVTY